MNKIPLIVVAGPTASGKTSLGIAISKRFGGEVISADSMQIYRGMNIATAKPTKEEMAGVTHHLIDIIDVKDSFCVAQFKDLAAKSIDEVIARGKIPVVVGGTGLYIDALVNNITFSEASIDPKIREELVQRAKDEGIKALLKELYKIDPEYAATLHENNAKKIIHALELWYCSKMTITKQNELSRLSPSPYSACYICLDVKERDFLYERINLRVDQMIENGLLQEAEQFRQKFGTTSAQAIGYKELEAFFNQEKTLNQAVESLKQSTRRYAKRQLTWFRRHENAFRIFIDEYETSKDLCEDAFKIIEKSNVLKLKEGC